MHGFWILRCQLDHIFVNFLMPLCRLTLKVLYLLFMRKYKDRINTVALYLIDLLPIDEIWI